MDQSDSLSISRERLKIGKYTRWAAELTEEEMYGLLWMLGEAGIRVQAHELENLDALKNKNKRARIGLVEALRYVQGAPKTLEQALDVIRDAARRDGQQSRCRVESEQSGPESRDLGH